METGNVLPLAAAVLCLLGVAGCAGHGSVHVVPLGGRYISTSKLLIETIKPDECYYWVDDQQRLCIAMRQLAPSIRGQRFSREYRLSLVLDGPPAGTGRTYQANRQTLRSCQTAGYMRTREASLGGLVTVWDYRERRLRGRFRLTSKRQAYSVLTNWAGDTVVLIVGEFTARPSRRRGEEIFAQTEGHGMERRVHIPSAKPVQTLPRDLQRQDE